MVTIRAGWDWKGNSYAAHLLAHHRFSIVIIGLVVRPDNVERSIGPLAAHNAYRDVARGLIK
jgi:hypothetical protein